VLPQSRRRSTLTKWEWFVLSLVAAVIALSYVRPVYLLRATPYIRGGKQYVWPRETGAPEYAMVTSLRGLELGHLVAWDCFDSSGQPGTHRVWVVWNTHAAHALRNFPAEVGTTAVPTINSNFGSLFFSSHVWLPIFPLAYLTVRLACSFRQRWKTRLWNSVCALCVLTILWTGLKLVVNGDSFSIRWSDGSWIAQAGPTICLTLQGSDNNWEHGGESWRYEWSRWGFGYRRHVYQEHPKLNATYLSAPVWLFLVLLALPPLFWLRGWARTRQSFRDPAALPCTRCGYDLRATPERCPECGLEVGNPASASTAVF
jgi:hypothetical protein